SCASSRGFPDSKRPRGLPLLSAHRLSRVSRRWSSLEGVHMNVKLLAAVLVGLLAGLVLQGTREQPQAHAQVQVQRHTQWEYKISPMPRLGNVTQQDFAEKLAKEYGTLGAEGWEYVGEAFAGYGQKLAPYFAIFKRPKA